jgi:hypothetical protein
MGRAGTLIAILILAGGLTARSAGAASAHLPAALYPPGARIGYVPSLSNHDLDCSWGFMCEDGIPLFHFATQDELHRVGGWAQFAGWRHLHRRMVFALYVSSYEATLDPKGRSWSRDAFDDLLLATRAQGYGHVRHLASLAPPGAGADAIAELQPSGSKDILVMAYWSATTEVEALVVFDHGAAGSRQTATRYLSRQVLAAIDAG